MLAIEAELNRCITRHRKDIMKTAILVLGLGLGLFTATAQDLTWAELLKRPEHWPKECAMKKSFEFQSGKSLKVGQKVTVLEMNATEIVIGSLDGKISFGTKPTDTDALAVANAAYAKLTPKQRELTYAAILKRTDLWPWSLKLTEAFDVGRKRFNKGDTVYLMSVKKDQLIVVPPTFDQHFELQPDDTDILTYARKYVDDPASVPGRLNEDLRGKLINAATGAAAPLNTNTPPKYYVIYHGARWCPYTQKFTPDLLALYQEMKPKRADFEVIYIPAEKSAAELQQYAKEVNFPWPAVAFQQKQKTVVLAGILGRTSLPEFWVLDRYGNVVVENLKQDRDAALKQFATLLKQPEAK